ncbi:MAG: anaerobic ribonucleoside-triphosphate reductase [Promethearchaeota archaeon]|jgi:ribonucleoside-triphosphate reductase
MDLLPKVLRTEGDFAEFDSSRIFDSLMKETGMNEANTKKITELVVRRIISSGIKFLSGPHIREIVCSILSEEHFENERKLYTRIGIPLMDYEEFLEQGLREDPKNILNPEKIHNWAANRISEEYTHLRILTSEESQAHLYGDIHIHKLRYFDLRPLSQIWDPRIILQHGLPPIPNFIPCCKLRPADDLKDAIHHLVKWLILTQNEFCGDQGFSYLTTFLAPYVKDTSEVELRKRLKEFLYEINHLSAVTGRSISPNPLLLCPTINKSFLNVPVINLHGKKKKYYKNYKEECLKLFKAFTVVFKEGDENNNPFKSPKHEIILNSDLLSRFNDTYLDVWDEISIMKTPILINVNTELLYKMDADPSTESKYCNWGILQDICLNLPRIAYKSKDEDEFLEILDLNLNLTSQILIKKYEIIKRRLKSGHLPLCSGKINGYPVYCLEDQNLSISFVGLNEAVKSITDFELHENSSTFTFGEKILYEMNKKCSEFSTKHSVSYVLSENKSLKAPVRFAELDLKHFQNIALPQSKDNKYYYTNAAHFRDSGVINISDKVKKQEKYHEFIHNGAIEYFSLTKLKINDLSLENFIKEVFAYSKLKSVQFYS